MRNALIVALFAVTLVGCAHEAHLYPANDVARLNGVLIAKFKSNGTGHGEIAITMPDHEILRGEYSIVRGGAIGFGSVYGSVYGTGGSAAVSGSSTSYVIPGGSPGMATAYGLSGITMECEFYNDNMGGHGNGACRSSKGGLYRLQY